MDYFDDILKFSIQHDYFSNKKCPVINVCPDPATQRLLINYRWLFKKTDKNEWTLIGDASHALSGLSGTATMEITLDATVNDPQFLYYTHTLLPDLHTGSDLQYKESNSHRTFQIKLSFTVSKPDKAPNSPTEVCIQYKPLLRYWEYILLSRTQEENIRELYLSDMEGLFTFAPAEPIEWNGQAGYRIRTTTPVELKEHYLSEIQLFENKKLGKKLLRKNISPPTPGRFIIFQQDTIQELIYF